MTLEARVYRCSGCGAPAREGSRQCDYCRAPIATLRCGRCFHMNPSEARHCSACGAGLGAEPSSSAAAERCPSCTGALIALETEWGRVLDCGCCGGQFVDVHVLRVLLERPPHPAYARQPYLPENPLKQAVVYRGCPRCSALMHRKNFGQSSGIIVDVCAPHGMWFDREELPRVLAFVENGGLARARSSAPRPPRSYVAPPPVGSDASYTADIVDAVVSLFAFVVKLVD